jgi:hypothetical protein
VGCVASERLCRGVRLKPRQCALECSHGTCVRCCGHGGCGSSRCTAPELWVLDSDAVVCAVGGRGLGGVAAGDWQCQPSAEPSCTDCWKQQFARNRTGGRLLDTALHAAGASASRCIPCLRSSAAVLCPQPLCISDAVGTTDSRRLCVSSIGMLPDCQNKGTSGGGHA